MSSQQPDRLSRRRFLRLAGGSTLTSIVLAACGAPAAPSPTSPPAAPTAAPTAAAQATSAPVAAPTAVPTAVPLRYVYPIFGGPQADQQAVQDAFNALLKTKGLNVDVTLDALDAGAYGDRVNLMNTGGEVFDLVFTATWVNNYFQNVSNGTIQPLDALLASDAPQLFASIPAGVWDATRVGGKIYAVPNQQKFPKTQGVAIRADLAEKYGLDVTKLNGYTDPALTAFMRAVKDGESDLRYVFAGYGPTEPDIWGYDSVGGQGFAGVKFGDTTKKVVPWFESAEFRTLAGLFQSWASAGFYPKETLKTEEADALLTAGQLAMILTTPLSPSSVVGLKQTYKRDFVVKPMVGPVMSTGAILATLTAVAATSKHPAEAVRLLELINTDPQVLRLLAYGVAGTHYQLIDAAQGVIKIPDDSTYKPDQTWAFGNTFNGYYTDPSLVGTFEQERKINASAEPSPIIGFSFDQVPVETELAQISTVVQEPLNVIYGGLAPDLDAAIATLNQAIKAAGGDKVLAEMQKQIDAWKTA